MTPRNIIGDRFDYRDTDSPNHSRTAPTQSPHEPTTIAQTSTNPLSQSDSPDDSPTVSSKSLGRLIGAFKTVSSKQINLSRGTPGTSVWQRNYYEHIVRHKIALQNIRAYVQNNPTTWARGRLHHLK